MVTKNGSGIDKLVAEFNEVNGQLEALELRKEKLREKLLDKVKAKSPDEKRSFKLDVGDYYVHRVVTTNLKWNLPQLKGLVGETLYKEIIKVKEAVDEDKLKEKVDAGTIKMGDVKKSFEPKYIEKLLVRLHTEDAKFEDSPRPFVEMFVR